MAHYDILGQEINIGDTVAQLQVPYNTSRIEARFGVITEFMSDKVKLVSAYQDEKLDPNTAFYLAHPDEYKLAVESYRKRGGVSLNKRVCGYSRVIKLAPNKEILKNIRKYEKATGKKLLSNVTTETK